MKTCSSDRKLFALVALLTINNFCAFSQTKIPHEVRYAVSCFYNGTGSVQIEFDSDVVLYVDFDRDEVVYTIPRYILDNLSELLAGLRIVHNAKKNRAVCLALNAFMKSEENPPEETDPPENIIYPSEEVILGDENILICFVSHFYPPHIKVSWTKNDRPVSEGVTLSQYSPNDDQTFNLFSTLTFIPREGDIYSCTVEHMALQRPKTKTWEAEFNHPSLGPDVYCGVGLTLGLLGVAAGTFLMVKGHHVQ